MSSKTIEEEIHSRSSDFLNAYNERMSVLYEKHNGDVSKIEEELTNKDKQISVEDSRKYSESIYNLSNECGFNPKEEKFENYNNDGTIPSTCLSAIDDYLNHLKSNFL